MKIELKKDGLEGPNLVFVKGLEEDLNEVIGKMNNGMDEKSVKELIDQYDYSTAEGFKELKSALDEQGTVLKSLTEKSNDQKAKSLGELLQENAEVLKEVKMKEGRLTLDLDTKAAGTILTTTNVTPQPNPYLPAPQIIGGVNRLVQTRQVITDYISKGTISEPRVVWVNQVSGEGDAEFVGEGELKKLVDSKWETEIENAKKVAAVVKISEEMLDDIPWMESEIDRLLRNKVDREINEQVLSGDGTGANLEGITPRVGGYVQACLNGKVEGPGLAEVLLAAATQIRSLGFTGRLIAFVNPCDGAASKMRKDADGNIVDLTGVLDNITVVETPEIAAGNFLIGDMSLFILEVYKALRVEIGWENDDFRRNLRTIIAEARVLLRISSNDLGAFVYDTFANVQTLIAAPVA